jgi:hypothetical protein
MSRPSLFGAASKLPAFVLHVIDMDQPAARLLYERCVLSAITPD